MITCVFPGQGAQKLGMGKEVFEIFPELVEKADNILGYSIKKLCLEDPEGHLKWTQYTQPALYVVCALTYLKRLKEMGKSPDFLAGHSLGEYIALFASGAFDFETGLMLVKKRGELMSQAVEGGMAAVIGLSQQDVKEIIEDNELALEVANYNTKRQVAVSGTKQMIEKAQPFFEMRCARYVVLNVTGAFHSQYMKPASQAFETYIEKFTFSPLVIPVIANITGAPYPAGQTANYLVAQLYSGVRWEESISYLMAQGEMTFEEVGPGHVMTKLIQRIKEEQHQGAAGKPKKFIEVIKGDNPYEQVKMWNETYPIGTTVYCPEYNEALVTRTKALVLFGHRAAVYVAGYQGYFDLTELSIGGKH